jgi:Mg-chelatase subunit ChlD
MHPAMLGWMAAAAAPVVIHLLSRRRYQEVPWAAMQYLLAAVTKNSRRIHLENWLLLAVRTALVLAVVLAVAEPMIERTGMVTHTGQPTHKLLVLDASYSMAYKPTDRSRFDRAKQLAEQIVEERSQGDGLTLILMADPPQVIVGTPSFSAAEFLGEIAATKITHGGADLATTLTQIEQVLAAARREFPRLTREQVYFLTDLGRTSWSPDLGAASIAEFRERARRLGEAAALTVIDLGQSGADNAAIEQLRLADGVVTVGQATMLAAEVRNFGRQAKAQQTVELHIDGERTAERTVDLAAGGSTAVNFPCYFDAAGEHVVELRMTPDLLDIDNHRYLAIGVKDQLRVLCVDGRPAGGRFKSATDFLMVALSPPAGERQRSRVRPEVVNESALLDTDLTQYDCVFLCNVSQFTEREANVLRSYLNFGGGVVFFLGDQVQPDNYNRLLAARDDPAKRVLPAQLLKPAEAAQYALDPLGYRHPLVAEFRDSEQAGLLTTPLQKYFKLQLAEPTRAQVALATDSGDPLIVEETIGRGRSILVATSADATWTAMPMWPSYVPIVQELLMFAMHGRLQEHNVSVGQALGGLLPAGRVAGIDVRVPSGEIKRAAVVGEASDRSWSFGDTQQSGIYRVEPFGGGTQLAAAQAFAVNLNTVESDLEQVTPEELAQDVWPGVRYFHRTNWRDTDADVSDEIVVRSRLHLWLLVAAVGLLVTESFLNWFSGRYAR